MDNANGEYWLEKIGIVAAPIPGQAKPPINENFVQIGKESPRFFADQSGRQAGLVEGFPGQSLAHYVYLHAKCPLPDYCMRMSAQFQRPGNQLKNDAEKSAKRFACKVFRSIRQDDSPEELRSYGLVISGKTPGPILRFGSWP